MIMLFFILVVFILRRKIREMVFGTQARVQMPMTMSQLNEAGISPSSVPAPAVRPVESGMPALNSAVPKNTRRFGVGWILLGITISLALFLILRPWIVLLFTIGPKEFIRMLAL